MILERALIVRNPWIDLILSGQKTWEMRSRPTNVRGAIGLIEAGSGLIVGSTTITDSLDEIIFDESICSYGHRDKHCIDNDIAIDIWRYPWVLSDTKRFEAPVPYQHPRGAVVWVNIKNLEIEV